jgi:hypothetical protein
VSAILLRLLIYVIIIGAVWFGVRKIWRDWKGQFRDLDKQQRQRDLAERKRPDVIDLKRGDDGTFRPKDRDNGRRD